MRYRHIKVNIFRKYTCEYVKKCIKKEKGVGRDKKYRKDWLPSFDSQPFLIQFKFWFDEFSGLVAILLVEQWEYAKRMPNNL